MDNNLMKWHLIAGKIEAAWLIVFGAITLGYVRSGELRLVLSEGWVRFTEVSGILMIIGGLAVLLFCRDNEKSNVLYRLKKSGVSGLRWRFLGIGLLVLVLITTLIVPYFTLVQDPFSATAIGAGDLSEINKTELSKSGNKKPAVRDFRDWVIIFSNNPDLSIYVGDDAVITGDVVLDKRLPKGYFFLRRSLVTHCEDCAHAVSITCNAGEGVTIPADGEWVAVKGKFSRGEIGNQSVLVLDVKGYAIPSESSDTDIHL